MATSCEVMAEGHCFAAAYQVLKGTSLNKSQSEIVNTHRAWHYYITNILLFKERNKGARGRGIISHLK